MTFANVTISPAPYYTISNSVPTITLTGSGTGYTTANPTWVSALNTSTNSSQLKVSGDAEITGNLVVGGRDVTTALEQICQRLAILQPKPELLERYQALREAYEHYRTLEALCVEQDDDTDKG